jgi:hypothetical protein
MKHVINSGTPYGENTEIIIGVLLLSSDDFYRDTSLVQGLIRVEFQ